MGRDTASGTRSVITGQRTFVPFVRYPYICWWKNPRGRADTVVVQSVEHIPGAVATGARTVNEQCVM